MLSPQRATPYEQWRDVGFALHNLVGVGSDAWRLDLWKRFGATCPEPGKFNASEHDRKWRMMGEPRVGAGALGVGSLRHWAKEDSPARYAEWAKANKALTYSARPAAEWDKDMELLQALQQRFPELGIGATEGAFKVVRVDAVGVAFEDTAAGLTGTVDAPKDGYWGHTVSVRDVATGVKRFMGLLQGDVPVKGPVSQLHQNIPTAADRFMFSQPDEDKAVLSSVTPNVMAQITIHRPKADDSCLSITVPGALDRTVAVKKKVDHFRSRVCEAFAQHNVLNLFVGHLTINNNNADGMAKTMSDDDLITAVISVRPELRECVRFSPVSKTASCGGLYYCDPTSNVWQQRHNVAIEEMLVSMFKGVPGLSGADKKHVESRRGRADMVHMLAAKVLDEGFRDRLDADPDLFAVANGCFSFEGGDGIARFRPVHPKDYVSVTAGWAYSREEAVGARAELEDFVAKVFPVAEERRVVLAFFASLLSGRRDAKKVLVMTDRRSGNNGKSTLMGLMSMFFGGYTESSKGTKFVCKGSFERDRDSHDAGLEPFRGKRLVVAEELKSNMTLDVAMLKRVAGGAGVQVGGRSFGAKETFQFMWQAGIVLIFNENDCPTYDQADTAFRDRLLFAPMRAKFVKDATTHASASADPWTFEADLAVSKRFPGWLSALADLLIEHYGVAGGFEQPPQSMTSWRDDVTAETNPAAQWCEDNLEVTGNMSDFVMLGELDPGIPNFKTLAKAFYTGVPGTAYVNKTIVQIRGASKSRRYVLKGVKKIADAFNDL